MQAIVGILAMIVCAMAAPLTTPLDSNNSPINPVANRNLPTVNHSLASSSNNLITPEQQLVIQNQLITQKGLESFAAQLSAQAGVPPPAGIAPFKGNRVPTKTEAQQLQIQLQAQKQIEAQVQNQAHVQAQLQAQNQALLQAQVNAQIQAQADAAARVKASSQQ